MCSSREDVVRTEWFRAKEWRTQQLSELPYWVEEEVLVLVGDVLVDQLSWARPLDPEQRSAYSQALTMKAEIEHRGCRSEPSRM